MKTSILLLVAISALSLSSIPSYANDDMDMKTSKSTVQKNIAAKGTVVSKDKAGGNVTLSHEAIPAINWGPMTMDFKVRDKMMLDQVKKGDKVQFTLLQQGNDYVITSIK